MIRVFTSIFAFTLALTGATAKFPTIVYKFNPTDAAGVGGSITVQYTASTVANIDAKLDFSHVDKKKIASLDASCKTHSVKSYNWHLHTGWMSSKSSASFKECSKMMTGNHFDPDKACGPASQHIAQPDCKKKSESYECTPFKYKSDQKSCEAGDLSGKFGAFLPGSDHKVSAKWTDHHFMPLSETSKHKLSIVLHAVCGKESPRFACAMGSKQN
ncbi:unnamed protein product [Peronospora farinosa]|uniref:Uncharacterized protein n=1 Tax=Peronospora farinosa TaxID=134698 RepID=A0ABN8CIX3_9STRA|nr:unnamed protein product [Peronospora farinosa]